MLLRVGWQQEDLNLAEISHETKELGKLPRAAKTRKTNWAC